MKRLLPLLLLSAALLLGGCMPATIVPYEATYTDLGIPALREYPEGIPARNIWDMIVVGDALWVGGGDYDKNSGPVTMHYYDLAAGQWQTANALPDEEISHFVTVGETVIATGTDPKENWDLGNYYRLTADRTWETVRNLPGGIHNYDMVEFDGRWFAALGVVEGNSPIVCSADGGETFSAVPMQKDGQPLDTAGGVYIRVHRFFVQDGGLYALFRFSDGEDLYEQSVYRYDGEAFVYHADWSGAVRRTRYNHKVVSAAEVWGGSTYLATGRLYRTADFIDVEEVSFPEGVQITDLRQSDGALYALGCRYDAEQKNYRITLWKSVADDFACVWYFDYALPAISFLRHQNVTYIGVGSLSDQPHYQNGTLLCVPDKE